MAVDLLSRFSTVCKYWQFRACIWNRNLGVKKKVSESRLRNRDSLVSNHFGSDRAQISPIGRLLKLFESWNWSNLLNSAFEWRLSNCVIGRIGLFDWRASASLHAAYWPVSNYPSFYQNLPRRCLLVVRSKKTAIFSIFSAFFTEILRCFCSRD